MIEIQKNYKITLTEEQARQLYRLLQLSNDELSYGDRFDELRFLHDELKKLFDTGIR
jgi:uncharacterized protein YpuA (DUF1002 family)